MQTCRAAPVPQRCGRGSPARRRRRHQSASPSLRHQITARGLKRRQSCEYPSMKWGAYLPSFRPPCRAPAELCGTVERTHRRTRVVHKFGLNVFSELFLSKSSSGKNSRLSTSSRTGSLYRWLYIHYSQRPCGMSKNGSHRKPSRVSQRWGLPWAAHAAWCGWKNTAAARSSAKAPTTSTR